MCSKLIIAAAGSGKTTYLVDEALKIKERRVLITTFTDENENEIRKRFIERHGSIPSNITIQTWFSFLLQHGIKPYQGTIYGDRDIRGLVLVNEKSGRKGFYKGKPYYYGEADIPQYYFTSDMLIYSDKMAKFAYTANAITEGLVVDRLSRIFQFVFIDEVQDMAGYDLELIKLFLESNITVLMVGDPRQVTYHTHEELKNKKYTSGQIEQYISERCKHCSVDVDHSSLNVSHRNHERICTLANQVFSEFTPCSFEEQSTTGHDGVFLVREDDIENYLSIYHPMQLRDKITVTVNPNYPAINFGVSKGLTFNRVLIYPTDTMMKWLIDRSFKLADISRSKLYVALTRARHSVGIVINAKYIHKCPTDIPLYQSELHHF